jgi:hypothetical protein
MSFSETDKRRVYLVCRPIFTGNNAQLRAQKRIRKLVNLHKKLLAPLISDFGEIKVVNIARTLLEKEIFQSDLKAKIEFPELFRLSPERKLQRAESENNAARSVAEALEEIASAAGWDDGPDHTDDAVQVLSGTEKIDGGKIDGVKVDGEQINSGKIDGEQINSGKINGRKSNGGKFNGGKSDGRSCSPQDFTIAELIRTSDGSDESLCSRGPCAFSIPILYAI